MLALFNINFYKNLPLMKPLALLRIALVAMLSLASFSLRANPTGGDVVGGSAQISGGAGTLVVTSATQRTIINWQDFSIGAGELTKFIQPSANSAVLNRVVGSNLSSIYGTLQSNGSVYLINPNGIVIGPGGVINAQTFIASTQNLSNENFLQGGDLLFSGASNASISNQGTITALGGDIVLIARQVENTGALTADSGTVALAAGTQILLKESGSERVFVQGGTGSVLNRGLIQSVQAELKANGDNMYALAINNEGIIRATGFNQSGGRVLLKSARGTVHNNGTITATRQRATETDGGDIQLIGERVFVTGGLLNASGVQGGTILIGGDYQGANPDLINSRQTYIGSAAQLIADGTIAGGKVVVWSDEGTTFNGSISALGAGTVEVSGKAGLAFNGTVVTGGGSLLLDPQSITVQATLPNIDGLGLGTDITSAAQLSNPATYGAVNSVITAAAINALLTGNATVQLSATVQITVNASITATGVGSLLLSAPTVNLNAVISLPNGGSLTGTATVVNVGAAGRIQNGIDVAASGATVNLAAATYIEQVRISGKNLTLNGMGATTVIQIPATPLTNSFVYTGNGATYRSIIQVDNASTVNIQNLTVDGLGVGSNFLNLRFTGIGYHNAGGTINNVTVKNINEGPTAGTQHGFGILAAVDTGSYHLNIFNSNITKFEKQGITLRGAGLTYNVSNNTLDNKDQIWATPNGIVVFEGATGLIQNNTLTNINGFLPGTDAAGILLLNAGAGTQVLNNTITNADIGIYSDSALGNLLIQGNAVTNGNYGIYISSTGGVTTLQNNIVANAAYVNGYLYSATDQVFHLINNQWINGVDGLYIQGSGATGPLVSINSDKFTNLSGYYIALFDAPHNVYSQPGSAHMTFDGLDTGLYNVNHSPLTLAQFIAVNSKIYDQRDIFEGLVLPYYATYAQPPVPNPTPLITANNPLLSPQYGQVDFLADNLNGFRPHEEGAYYIAFRSTTAGNAAGWGNQPVLSALSSYDVQGNQKDIIRILPRTEGSSANNLSFLIPPL
ncbi:MAG: hypothetical protein B9S32_15135 [Verrucomicrobia bacterium Tous-C9LFEB]|nr:MAG: hypothetical protein B9S32_15135 [Verrucomicrobia bacterium Tous-C9LFEB]